ncbi:hypothetical protein HOY82DRAFT_565275 [Tuber indicum]|nr:hypothetical protein HOY82DRAFT_565275 [Tuber indicum]
MTLGKAAFPLVSLSLSFVSESCLVCENKGERMHSVLRAPAAVESHSYPALCPRQQLLARWADNYDLHYKYQTTKIYPKKQKGTVLRSQGRAK